MHRTVLFSAALLAALGTAGWSQIKVDVPAASGAAPQERMSMSMSATTRMCPGQLAYARPG